MAGRVQELSDPAEGAFMVLLLHHGEPHSIYTSRPGRRPRPRGHLGGAAETVWVPAG